MANVTDEETAPVYSFALRSCRCCAAGEASGDGSGAPPAGYTSASRTPEPGKAPAMRYRVIGGGEGDHLLRARAFPTIEVFATESAVELRKTKDPQSTLELFRV